MKPTLVLIAAAIACGHALNAAVPIDFDPTFETEKSRVSFAPGVTVVRGSTQTIAPGVESVCPTGTVFQYNNGDLHVYNRRSSDGGRTWVATPHVLEVSTFQYPAPDGEVVMFQSYAAPSYSRFGDRASSSAGRGGVLVKESAEKGVLEGRFFRSKDHGVTRSEETARLHLPAEFKVRSGHVYRRIIQTADGSLLINMSWREGRSRKLAALRSTDRGRNWHFLSIIAFDVHGRSVSSEGFNETCLLSLPDGRVMSFMRSGASYTASLGSIPSPKSDERPPFPYKKQTPLYTSTSFDGGRTWSHADPIAPFGVLPDAVRMKNGILVVSYGRPGNWLMFSPDEGRNWAPVLQFYNDLYPPDCSNYFSICEVAPDILLVAYARIDPNDSWRSDIVGTYFQVKRTRD